MSDTADGLVVFDGPADLAVLNARLPALFLADAKSSERFWEFFVANIRNRNTRRAYYKAVCRSSSVSEGEADLQELEELYDELFQCVDSGSPEPCVQALDISPDTFTLRFPSRCNGPISSPRSSLVLMAVSENLVSNDRSPGRKQGLFAKGGARVAVLDAFANGET